MANDAWEEQNQFINTVLRIVIESNFNDKLSCGEIKNFALALYRAGWRLPKEAK